jgi:hypothetical protein
VGGHALGDVAEVALVGDVKNSAALRGGVVLLLEGECPLLQSEVRGFFFGAGEQADALCGCGVAGCGYGGPHLRGGVLLVLESVEGIATET